MHGRKGLVLMLLALIAGVPTTSDDAVIFEVTPEGEIVWELRIEDAPVGRAPGWFYKAERICAP